jgi:hypothetical protein
MSLRAHLLENCGIPLGPCMTPGNFRNNLLRNCKICISLEFLIEDPEKKTEGEPR